MNKEKSCGVVIYNDKKEVLLLKHRSGNHYDFCKGHIEENETELECALREVEEETGLSVSIDPGFKVYTHYVINHQSHKTVCWFTGEKQNDLIIQQSEISDYRWLDYEQALTTITFETSKNVLRAWHHYMTKLLDTIKR